MPVISQYKDEYFAGVEALWQEAFPNDAPSNKASTAIAEKIRFQPELMLVALEGPLVVGSVMAGYEGHRGGFPGSPLSECIATKGLGERCFRKLKGVWRRSAVSRSTCKSLRQTRPSSGSMRKAGYEIEPRISMSKRLSSRASSLDP
jgi:hypothetical protein